MISYDLMESCAAGLEGHGDDRMRERELANLQSQGAPGTRAIRFGSLEHKTTSFPPSELMVCAIKGS